MEFKTRAAIFWRSFLMQALWCPATMQNLGFLFALEPALETAYPDAGRRREAALRHLTYFNTNPYMAGFVLGFIARLEESGDTGRVEKMKKALGAALAAVGDASIWGSLQPAAAGLAVLSAVAAWSLDLRGAALLCISAYLLFFNIPALWLRWRGIGLGYDLGEELPTALQDWRWQAKTRRLRRFGLFCAVAAPLFLAARESLFVGPSAVLPLLAIAAVAALRKKGFSSPALYALCGVAAISWRGVLALL